jgi:hypothetical protein
MVMTNLKKPIASENQEQRALVKWLSYHPIVRDYFLKLNNEGKRSEAEGWNLKMMGLKPGASDLFIFYPTTKYHGLFLEVKRNKKYTPSEMRTDTWVSQQQFLDCVKKIGFAAETCYGWEDGVSIIERYLLDN